MAEKKSLTGMPCEEFTMLVSGVMEGEPIGFRDRLRMLWHKIKCVYCRRFLEQLYRIRNLLGAEAQPQKMPSAMKHAVEKNLRNLP